MPSEADEGNLELKRSYDVGQAGAMIYQFVPFNENMNWVGTLTVILTAAMIVFTVVKYYEYKHEVQRDLYNQLVGQTYPRFSDQHGVENTGFR